MTFDIGDDPGSSFFSEMDSGGTNFMEKCYYITFSAYYFKD